MISVADSSGRTPGPSDTEQGVNRTRDLVELAVRGLEDMFDEREQLFCHRSKLVGERLENEGLSIRYTLITLLGLYRFEESGGESRFDVEMLVDSLLRRIGKIDNLGDTGLLLWLCSLVLPDGIGEIQSHLPLESAVDMYADGKRRLTVELSWFLTGLVYACGARPHLAEKLAGTAFDVLMLVKNNWGGRGIFGHQSLTGLTGALRGRIGCFADQVYPIYAFSKFAETFSNKEAAEIAQKCADTICGHQGGQGQWWWHYDAVTNSVRGRYPVFSVHQHSMAPMALFAAAELTGRDYSDSIYRGVEWIRGNNELGLNMIDVARNRIWRSFYLSRPKSLLELAYSAVLPLRKNMSFHKKLHTLLECRPYCFGWLLYAFARDKRNQP